MAKLEQMSICDRHFRQLLRHQSMLNPFDLLGGGVSRFFDRWAEQWNRGMMTLGSLHKCLANLSTDALVPGR